MHVGQSSGRRTQDVFRRANERLLDAVSGRVDGELPIPFLCECLDPSCRATVELTVSQFVELRDTANRYAIVKGHPTLDGERVVTTDGDISIVEKT